MLGPKLAVGGMLSHIPEKQPLFSFLFFSLLLYNPRLSLFFDFLRYKSFGLVYKIL